MKVYNAILILNLVNNLSYIHVTKGDEEYCKNKRSCSECIQTKNCAWCSRTRKEPHLGIPEFSGCYSSEQILDICEENFIENPKSVIKIVTNQPMRNGKIGNSVQIRPQEVTVKARRGEVITIDIEFKKAEDYPVDLYYLMDFSSSMSKHKNNLSKLGNKMAETMKNLTSDFQLGFGTFVDKVTLPYTSTLPSHLAHPCPNCRSPYSYKNHMSLSNETNRFSVEVRKAEMSGNIDTPEGVFDGLMQSMVCRQELNWREKARHIIVVSTDAPFHLAGDGKLGGVVEPHDEKCHLDKDGYYTHSLVFDYPSVSQINFQASENNMNIIFAVVNKVKQDYHSLAKEINGASMGLLDAGENIAELIKAQYEKISTTIKLIEDSDGPVNVSFSARCSLEEQWSKSNKCTNVKGSSSINFKVHLSILDCSAKNLHAQKITIKPEGINETLTINLEGICDCECSAIGQKGNEVKSQYCSSSGNLICGQCECNTGYIGEKCECSDQDGQILNVHDTTTCKTSIETNELCSGRGTCTCGVCQCYTRSNKNEEITGKYCECDNYSCEKVDGLLCSGHGTCKCGKCVCDLGWSGENCDCSLDETQCQNEKDDEVCSGKGDCICGMCHCHNGTSSDVHRYSGKYCQNCITCGEQCSLYNNCVECITLESGPLAKNNCSKCSDVFHLTVNIVESVEELQKNLSQKTCTTLDSLGCTYTYIYDFKENGRIAAWADKKTKCPKPVNLLAVIAGTTGGTIFIGLLSVIIWKVLIDYYDKREYEKFERERNLAKWGRGENPLFKTPTTKYENPTYNQSNLPETTEEED